MAGLRVKQKSMRRRRILEATMALLTEKGYAESSLQEIADLAELTVPTIYNYFSSKSHIVLELLFEQQNALSKQLDDFIETASQRSAVRAITDWIRIVTDGAFHALDREVWRSIYQAGLKDDDLGPFMEKLGDFYIDKSGIFLESLKKRNLIDSRVNTRASAKLLDSICEHYFRRAIFSEAGHRKTYGEEIHALVKELYRGLAPTVLKTP